MTPTPDGVTPGQNGAPGDGAPPGAGALREHEARLAERRLLDEIARHRRSERDDIVKLRNGCLVFVVVSILLMAIGFVFF